MTKEISRSKLELLLIKIKKVGFHKGNSQQIQSDSRDVQPVRFELDCIFESVESKLVFHTEV